MIRDLLIPLANGRGDDAALRAGRVLAEAHQARLAALVCVPLTIPVTFEWSALPSDLYARVQQAERERGQRVAAHVRELLATMQPAAEVRVVETQLMPPASIAALHARHADLSIVSGVPEGSASWAEGIFLDLLLESGRPVLVVPAQFTMTAPARHALVAWQPTREAARAVHDGLPLLRKADSVDVLVVDPVVAANRHGEEPGADIAAHLARHGVRANVVAHPRGGDDVAGVILRHAQETGAELIVAGAYSHARLRQALLGGVTRSLLRDSPVPMLLSH